MLSEYIDKLPEADRESFKKSIEKVVIIGSREDASRLLKENSFLKSEHDAIVSRTYAKMEAEFKEEKLPALLEAERKKGEKQPWEIEIEKLKNEQAQAKKELNLEKQKARALQKASELKIPVNLIDKFIGETDEDTDKQLESLVNAIKPWAENQVNEVKKSLLGNNGKPDNAGSTNTKQMSRADFDRLDPVQKVEIAKTHTIINT
jgi:hypothetical protein